MVYNMYMRTCIHCNNTMEDKKFVDKGKGRTDAADGTVWPWVFNAASSYWSQIAVKLRWMAER